MSQRGKNFINLFCSLANKRIIYGNDRVTPYMHTLPDHVPLFIRKFPTLKQFTGQGVEKNNDDAKTGSKQGEGQGGLEPLQKFSDLN